MSWRMKAPVCTTATNRASRRATQPADDHVSADWENSSGCSGQLDQFVDITTSELPGGGDLL